MGCEGEGGRKWLTLLSKIQLGTALGTTPGLLNDFAAYILFPKEPFSTACLTLSWGMFFFLEKTGGRRKKKKQRGRDFIPPLGQVIIFRRDQTSETQNSGFPKTVR